MTRYVRWLVPVAAVALIGGGVAVSSASASSTPDIPARTPEQLIAAVAMSDVQALSGTVTTKADLGFPQLPSLGGQTSSSATDPQSLLTRLLAGENTIRVSVDGPSKVRAALVDQFAELQVVRNGDTVWTYSSTDNTATKYTVPASDSSTSAAATPDATPSISPSDVTPEGMAGQALSQIGDTTSVTVGQAQVVAGRDAYTLVIAPKTDATLVDRIEIAVDAEKSAPLQVQVFARDQTAPAFSTGFSSVDFSTPDASLFDFTPPGDATVTEGTPFDKPSAGTSGIPALPKFSGKPNVIGTGWASVIELPAPVADPTAAAPSTPPSDQGTDPSALLDQLTQKVDGGRAISTALLSILLTDDGRVLVGAVPVDALVAAAR